MVGVSNDDFLAAIMTRNKKVKPGVDGKNWDNSLRY